MKGFHAPYNVPVSIAERWEKGEDMDIFVSDCLWVIRAKGYYEFYYNPNHFIGKIDMASIPPIVLERLKNRCAYLKYNSSSKDYSNTRTMNLKPTDIRLSKLHNRVRIGNWFYCQGQHYLTWRNSFICDDMYVEGLERWCDVRDISEPIVYDMLRMSTRSTTPNNIKHLFDFDIFQGVDCSRIIIESFHSYSWNAPSWSSRFKGISEDVRKHDSMEDRNALRTMRVDVFIHTVSLVKRGEYETDEFIYRMNQETTSRMIAGTKFYSREISLPESNGYDNTTVSVVNDDCLSEAHRLKEEGYDVAVLNMANRQNPGGSVVTGAGAQEENIFRRSNLFLSLFQYAPYAKIYGLKRSSFQYPLDRNHGGIYSPKVLVFRGTESEGYPLLKKPFHTSVISVAAINSPELTEDNRIVDSLIPAMKSKIRTIFRIGIENGHDALVLGAFGCGAFKNPPEHVAKLFHEVMNENEFFNKFKHISFAITDDHNSRLNHNPNGNFQPFCSEFIN